MSSCGSTGFLTASEARHISRNYKIMYEEICAIQQSILVASELHVYEATINDSPMTSGENAELYYKVWSGTEVSREATDELDFIVKYFENLQYSISIEGNATTMNTLQWHIFW